MNRVAMFTTSFGGIDSLKRLPWHSEVDSYFITDSVAEADRLAAATWTRVLPAAPASAALPERLRARYHKTQIHRLAAAQPYRWLVWADASLQFGDLDFIAKEAARLEGLPPHRRLLLVPHPDRSTVREEYAFVRDEIKNGNAYLATRYRLAELGAQMAFLAAEGMNSDARLRASGFWLVENNDRINACWDAWWDHTQRFGVMDQLPLPPLLEKFELVPEELHVNIFRNRHFRWVQHRQAI